MQYIKNIENVWHIEEYYSGYLPTVWSGLSVGAKELIRESRNGLKSSESFHDGVVHSIQIETAVRNNLYKNNINLELHLACGEQLLVMYDDVLYFEMCKSISMVPIPPICAHELTIGSEGELVHEIAFLGSDIWRFVFMDVTLKQK